MDRDNKYSLDKQLLQRIEDRAETPNGNEEYNMIFPLLLSIYGKIDVIQNNPMIALGRMIQKHPAIFTACMIGAFVLLILSRDPTNFEVIAGWFTGDPTLP